MSATITTRLVFGYAARNFLKPSGRSESSEGWRRSVHGRTVMPGLVALALIAGIPIWLATGVTVSHWVPEIGPMTPKAPSFAYLRNRITAWPGSICASPVSIAIWLPLTPPLALTSSTARRASRFCIWP